MQEHQIDLEYKKNKNIQIQTKLSSLKNKTDFLEQKNNLELFEVQARNKKKNHTQSEYQIDKDNDFIKIKTVRFPNNRSRLMQKLNNRDRQQSHKFNSLYLLPKNKTKNKTFFFKNSSLSFINTIY